MKTQNEILTDVYKIVQSSPIENLNGGIYKKTRPTSSNLEDCVISIISGVRAKFLQDAAIYIKIFYNDIKNNNTYFEDASNGQKIEQLLIDLSEDLINMNGYSFLVETRETGIEKVLDDDIAQHFAILKMNFLLT